MWGEVPASHLWVRQPAHQSWVQQLLQVLTAVRQAGALACLPGGRALLHCLHWLLGRGPDPVRRAQLRPGWMAGVPGHDQDARSHSREPVLAP